MITKWDIVYSLDQSGSGNWIQTAMTGKDISISTFGQMWLLTTDNKVFWDTNGVLSDTGITDVKRICVGRDDLYMLTNTNKIVRYNPYDNTQIEIATGKDVYSGPTGYAWVITTENQIKPIDTLYNTLGDPLRELYMPKRIYVDISSLPVVLNELGQIFQWTGTKWNLIEGDAKDMCLGLDGSIWVVNYYGQIGNLSNPNVFVRPDDPEGFTGVGRDYAGR